MTEIVEFLGVWGRLAGVVALPIALACALWVWNDATRLGRNGARVSRGFWTTLVFLACPIALPGYVYLRSRLWKPEALAAGATPEDLEPPPSLSEEDQARQCSPERFREVVREHSGEPPGAAFAAAREQYDRHYCADVMDVGRFEEIVAEEIRRSVAKGSPS